MSRATLSKDTIVSATIRLIGESGAEAVTMRSLGAALGTDPTAVYRHFRDKAELLRAVSERLLGEVTVDLPPDDHGWREVTTAVCTRLRAALLDQPRLSAAVQSAPPLQPTEFAITETLLRQFAVAGLEPADAAAAYHSVIELTVGSAVIDAPVQSLTTADRDRQYTAWRRVYADLDPDEYPYAAATARHLYRGSAEARFLRALDALLDGLVAAR